MRLMRPGVRMHFNLAWVGGTEPLRPRKPYTIAAALHIALAIQAPRTPAAKFGAGPQPSPELRMRRRRRWRITPIHGGVVRVVRAPKGMDSDVECYLRRPEIQV